MGSPSPKHKFQRIGIHRFHRRNDKSEQGVRLVFKARSPSHTLLYKKREQGVKILKASQLPIYVTWPLHASFHGTDTAFLKIIFETCLIMGSIHQGLRTYIGVGLNALLRGFVNKHFHFKNQIEIGIYNI